ncbi:NIPSNAP family protein [Marinobacter sp. 2_MG-2023]|uniref:NIPSNAP family protein n=1 Tax=Marinobacter sp. 2_MG-2023 TaxID=3062679 RepID=UPI0026E231EF|nr:NIPSNAP family protein [Marinobacter sp. 2_MG-2023]MDO6441439.1 NIPSNAP family protein [Marinobacter sp. 2_MG-2023]
MILDERTYTIRPDGMQDFLELYETQGLPLLREHLGGFAGFFKAETGIINQVVHLWTFKDAGDREQRRIQLWSDQRWKDYTTKVLPLIERMENRLLVPTSFSQWR